VDYRMKIDQQSYTASVKPRTERGAYEITLGDRTHNVLVEALSPCRVRLHLDGQPHAVLLAKTTEGTWVWMDGCARLVQEPPQEIRRKSRTTAAGSDFVTPPTPATVVRLLVEKDQPVEKGQPLVVVSAMKMEITLTAPHSGMVSAIHTTVGAQVRPGEILVDISVAS
jgi:biotin carboxyl carrier protein